MFRRLWSHLPQDIIFADNLEDLGYFINEQDEIRCRDDPLRYFRYSLSKNERVNERQRYHFNNAIRNIIHTRLAAEGLETLKIPFNRPPTAQYIPILASANLTSATRAVVFLGESSQILGALAYRIMNGKGGIDQGSLTSVVRDLKKQQASRTDERLPGILVANFGETWWWPEGKKPITIDQMQKLPMASSVHYGRDHDEVVNCVAGLETPKRNMRYILETVVPTLIGDGARIDVIAVGDSVGNLLQHLEIEEVWVQYKDRLDAIAFIGCTPSLPDARFTELREFLMTRCRSWVITPDYPTPNTLLSDLGGNEAVHIPDDNACPVFSSGEKYYHEAALCRAREHVLAFFQEVALAEGQYRNPAFTNVPAGVFGTEDREDPCRSMTEDGEDPWNSRASEALLKDLAEEEEKRGGKKEEDVDKGKQTTVVEPDGWTKFVLRKKQEQQRKQKEKSSVLKTDE